jgi:hypothetical protein
MSVAAFKAILVLLALAFAAAFSIIVVPPLLVSGDVTKALSGGFVNPFSSGYALDAIVTWWVLAAWIYFEAKSSGVRHGWVALLVGIVPGVSTGLAVYLLLRLNQTNRSGLGRLK